MNFVGNKILLFLLLTITICNSFAVEDYLFWTGEAPNLEKRKEYAMELLGLFKNIDKQVPTLSPSEKEWLKREIDDELAKGQFTSRALRAMKSTEYCLDVAKNYLRIIINPLGLIVNKTYSDKQQEILLWAVVSENILHHELWQCVETLTTEGVVNKEIGDIDDNYYLNATLWSKKINRDIIIPYLNNTLPVE